MSQALLEYSDQIVYVHKQVVHFHDIIQNRDIARTPLEIDLQTEYIEAYDRLHTAIGCTTDSLLVVCRIVEKDLILPPPLKCEYEIMVFNKKLDITSRNRITDIRKKSITVGVLQDEIGRLNFNCESVEKRYGEKVILPHEGSIRKTDEDTYIFSPKHRSYVNLQATCYDKYNDSIFMLIFSNDPDSNTTYQFEEFNKDKDWVLLRKSDIGHLDPRLGKEQRQEVYHMECGRYYISIGLKQTIHGTGEVLFTIYLFNKETFKLYNKFSGCHPTFRDDYDDWFKNNLNIMKNIETLNKINEDLLKIILFYIS